VTATPRLAPGRVAARTAAALLLLAAAVVATPGAARADGGLVASDPADGAALAAGPTAVRLTFDRAPDLARSHVGVADGAAALLGTGKLTLVGGRTLRQPVRAPARGTVVVAYHVEFDDGTEVTGHLRFSVGTGEPPPAAAGDPRAGDAERVATSAADAGHGHGIDALSAALLVVDFAVLFGVVALLWLRPRRRDDGPTAGGTDLVGQLVNG
jgi:methionine-rich copper-binding protein CopC